MAEIGEVIQVPGELEIEWRIKNFLTHLEKAKCGDSFCSPAFYLAGSSWKIIVYPRCKAKDNIKESVGLSLVRSYSSSSVNLEFNENFFSYLSIKTSTGKKICLSALSHRFDFSHLKCEYHVHDFISHDTLMKRRDELMPSGNLTIACTLKTKESKVVKGYIYPRVNCSEDMHGNDMKNDLMLNVGGEKFQVHRNILTAGSPVFSRKLEDNPISELKIEDIDLDSMKAVLQYMHTGEIYELTMEKVFSIYAAAHKYEMEGLKSFCLTYIKQHLSEEWLSDVMKFAIENKEKELAFFAREFAKIIPDMNQEFMNSPQMMLGLKYLMIFLLSFLCALYLIFLCTSL